MKSIFNVTLILCLPLFMNAQISIRQYSVNKSLSYSNIVKAGGGKFGYAAQATSSDNISSVMIAKLNRLLIPEWLNFYTDSINMPGTDLRQQITACANGGFAAAFTPESRNGSVFVFKTDSTGRVLWSKEYHVNSGSQGTVLKETRDGNILVAGNRQLGFTVSASILSLDGQNGDVRWFKTLTIGGENAIVGALALTRDSGFVIAGTGTGNVGFVARYNKLGNMIWTRVYKAAQQGNYFYQDIKAITQTKDGGFAYTGLVPSAIAGNGYDMCLVKLAPNGALKWASGTGTTGEDAGLSIQQNNDSSYSVTGSFTSVNAWLVKFSKTGQSSIFQKVLNMGYLSQATSVQDARGRYIMAGTFYTGIMIQPHGFVAALDSNGNSCSGYLSRQPVTPLNITPVKYTIVEADITRDVTTDTAYFKKTSPPVFSTSYCSGERPLQEAAVTNQIQVQAPLKAEVLANPVKNAIQLRLSGGKTSTAWMISITDMQGKLMLRQPVEGSTLIRQVDVSNWNPGLYMVNVRNGNWQQTIRVMVIK